MRRLWRRMLIEKPPLYVFDPSQLIRVLCLSDMRLVLLSTSIQVIEHLLQASDVSHTMQHFHVFRKWNERLFLEMYLAFKNGRSTADPSKFWYKGEIGFFDFYVIPLAKKLKECGVFGVSSGECLDYATKNRQQWEAKGAKIVETLVAKAEYTYERMQRNQNMDLKISMHRRLSASTRLPSLRNNFKN